MARLELILVVIFFAFTIFAFIDCLRTEPSRVRALPKAVWALIVILFTPFGGILWFALGKERLSARPTNLRRAPRAPDDDPEFLRRLGADKQHDERIRDLEARLAELDDDQDGPKDQKNSKDQNNPREQKNSKDQNNSKDK